LIFGRKNNDEDEPDEDEEEQEQVLFQGSLNGLDADLKKNAKLARAGLIPTKEIISDALSRRAYTIIMEPKGAKTAIRLVVDGIGYSGGVIPAKRGQAITQMMKLLAGLDIQDRSNPQSGGVKVEFEEKPYELYIDSAPVKPGTERIRIRVQDMKNLLTKPADVDLSEDMKLKIRAMGTQHSGIILICGPPESGTTTTSLVALHAIDSYLYTVFALGEIGEHLLTNVSLFEPDPEHDLGTTIERIIRKEGELLYIDPLVDEDTARVMYEYNDKIGFICEMPVATPAQAIQQMIEWLGGEATASCLRAVITQKLIRKLCVPCREAYRPNPKLLKKLGLPPEIKVLYREPSPPDEDDPEALSIEEMCEDCDGMPYHGRVGVYELIEITEGMKEVIMAGAEPSEIRRQAADENMTTLQKDGLRHVASGVTSLEELQRAFSSGKSRKKSGKRRRRPQ
jgi:type II secretory ATPase GspE/PulE/Tfp pilus assembly ATPase PilB-like protein